MSSVGINVGALLAQLGALAMFILLLAGIIWFAVRLASRGNNRRSS